MYCGSNYIKIISLESDVLSVAPIFPTRISLSPIFHAVCHLFGEIEWLLRAELFIFSKRSYCIIFMFSPVQNVTALSRIFFKIKISPLLKIYIFKAYQNAKGKRAHVYLYKKYKYVYSRESNGRNTVGLYHLCTFSRILRAGRKSVFKNNERGMPKEKGWPEKG